jgi:hypothetical protein
MESEYLPVKKPSTVSKNDEERKLACVLKNYIYEGSDAYDAEFDAEIRALQPDWFLRTKKPKERKRDLLIRARSGQDKPNNATEARIAAILNSYINKNSSSYDAGFDREIRLAAPSWFENSIERSKRKLMVLAKEGIKRSDMRRTDASLVSSLNKFTSKKNKYYDSHFNRVIRSLRPDWFNTADAKKTELLRLAEGDATRPLKSSNNPKTKQLALALRNYTVPSSQAYDPVFQAKITSAAPDWFKRTSVTNEELLALANSGARKPLKKSADRAEQRLANGLRRRMSEDKSFAARIKKMRPDWFDNTRDKKAERVAAKKTKLLKLAADGVSSIPDELVRTLRYYTTKSCDSYDHRFYKAIHKLNPIWLRTRETQVARLAVYKTKLLVLKEFKPADLSNLRAYTNKTGGRYDPVFSAKIGRRRPDLFTGGSSVNKQYLLEFALSGAKRPSKRSDDSEEKRISIVLHNCTCKGHCSFDPAFTRAIRRARPDWFKK